MSSERLIAALDIGTTKILCLVAEMDQHGEIYIIGQGEAPAAGLRRGVVVDMESTVASIRKAVSDAQMVSGTEIDRVTVGIAGEHVRSINSHGVIAVNRADNEITAAEVARAMEAAKTVAIPVDREIVHVIPQEYSVDEQAGIKDPIGMTGVRLEVQAHIVTASVTSAKNIYRALERCQLGVDHIVLEGLALSQVVLTDDELESGVILVDIGGEITNLAVYVDGAIRATGVVVLGGKNVTSDIAIGLRTGVEQAEKLKLAYGSAMASATDPEEMVTVPAAGARADRQVSRHILASIIEPRMEEIFSLVAREIRNAGVTETPPGGMVLTGGGSLLPATAELAEQIFDMPTRVGDLLNIAHTADELRTPRHLTAHGLIYYGLNHDPVKSSAGGKLRGFVKKFENWISRKL